MTTHCTADTLQLQPHFNRQVSASFNAGRLTSDAGGVLLRETEKRISLFGRLAECFTDYRNVQKIEHSVEQLLRQRIYGIALGYEDLNDHDQLRFDSHLALLCEKADLSGERRKRSRDRGVPLAGASTLNRMELGVAGKAPLDRYRKIVDDAEKLDRLLVDLFMESQAQPPEEIWLDLDATDNALHGRQEESFYHGYYDGY